MRTHYPRTPHLPWSPGATSDDVRTADLSHLIGREVVVTEKLDGENTTLYGDGLHARSLDSAHHPSRAWVKALQSRIARHIPPGWRICGENMYARHSLPYHRLDSYFYGFSVWDTAGHCLDWDRTVPFLGGLGIPTPSVLWRGTFDERALRALRLDLSRQEGYVVRTAEGFTDTGFRHRVAKWVRAGHVRTDTHWMHSAVVANGLGPTAALWSLRSGGSASVEELADALGVTAPASDAVVAEVAERLGQSGDERLTAVLAALLHGERRSTLTARLRPTLGMRLARRVADVVGLSPGLHRPYPDEERRTGLLRLSYAADLGVLHSVAAATAQSPQEREQTEWSALYAEEIRGWQPPRFDGLAADRGGPLPGRGAGCVRGGTDQRRRGGHGRHLALARRRLPPTGAYGRPFGQRQEHLRSRYRRGCRRFARRATGGWWVACRPAGQQGCSADRFAPA